MVSFAQNPGRKPADFLGKGDFDGAKRGVFVKWHGAKKWMHNTDPLWWSPSELGLDGVPTYPVDRDASAAWVRVEDLCWVLEPEKLCRAITGMP